MDTGIQAAWIIFQGFCCCNYIIVLSASLRMGVIMPWNSHTMSSGFATQLWLTTPRPVTVICYSGSLFSSECITLTHAGAWCCEQMDSVWMVIQMQILQGLVRGWLSPISVYNGREETVQPNASMQTMRILLIGSSLFFPQVVSQKWTNEYQKLSFGFRFNTPLREKTSVS